MRRETRESVHIWRIEFRQCGDVCRNVTQWRCRRCMRSVKIVLSTEFHIGDVGEVGGLMSFLMFRVFIICVKVVTIMWM